MLALAACDSASPTVDVVQVAVRSTPTPTPHATAIATATATSAPTPIAMPTDEEFAVAHLSQTVPWLGSPPDALHRRAAESIIGLWGSDAGLGDSVARMEWVVDEPTEDEAGALAFLLELSASEPALTALLLQLPWVVDMPADTSGSTEWSLFRLLLAVGLDSPDLAQLLLNHPLFADDLTHEEAQFAELLVETGSANLEWAKRLAATGWVSDGIERYELRLLSAAIASAESPMPHSEFLLGIPGLTDQLTGDLRVYATRALTELALDRREHLEEVTAQRWFADGLTEEEAVLIVILAGAAEDLPAHFRDLLAGRFSLERTVGLPVTGEVRLWAVQDKPFPDGEGILQAMEDAARYLEELVQEPLPTNVLILSVVDPRKEQYGLGGELLNTHIRVARNPLTGNVEEIAHETGHFIFTGPRWYSEGACELGRAFVHHRTGLQTMDQRREELANTDRCSRYANIRHWAHNVEEAGATPGDRCPYILGEKLLLNAWDLLGQDNVSAALRELHVLDRDAKQPVTDELIFDVFLRNTPVEKEGDFRDLYRRLHGGAFTLQDTDFNDDHGDEAVSASIVMAGQSVTGELDYTFDFDYLRFRAQEDQKYRITTQHPSLPPDWLAIYGHDGVTLDTRGLKSSSATPSGIEMLWTASSTGDYYVAVRNFGGLTGAYTLSIDPVEDEPDDHGDTPASATSLTPGQPVQGTVDGSFDLDYFRLQAGQGDRFHFELRGGTLEALTIGLYGAEGRTPAEMREEDAKALIASGGDWVDVIDLPNVAWRSDVSFDWTAPRAGEFLLAVSGGDGSTGSYTVTVTTPER